MIEKSANMLSLKVVEYSQDLGRCLAFGVGNLLKSLVLCERAIR